MESGLVFNIQHYSLHDGPGIRTTVFLKGCPLCCAWCHNPEGMRKGREVMLTEDRCIACGACREVCPLAENLVGEGPLPGQVPDCLLCGACTEACPTNAREMIGNQRTVAEVTREVLKDLTFYEESGGGVTISGGEPLAQPAFTIALLKACRSKGMHTVLDTTGLGRQGDLLAAGDEADLVLYDLKSLDEVSHEKLTGVSNREILNNLRALDDGRCKIWIRIPVVPGHNDDPATLRQTAEFVSGLRNVELVCLLPFHRTGLHKFERLGMAHPLDHIRSPSDEEMNSTRQLFEDCGLAVRVGG